MTDKVEIKQRETRKRNPESILRSEPFCRQKIAFGVRATFSEAHSVAEFIRFADEKIDILREKHRISGVEIVVEHKKETDENEWKREDYGAFELHFLREHEKKHAYIDKKRVLRTDEKSPCRRKACKNEERLPVFRNHDKINSEQREHQIERMRHVGSTHEKVERAEESKEHRKERSLRIELFLGYFPEEKHCDPVTERSKELRDPQKFERDQQDRKSRQEKREVPAVYVDIKNSLIVFVKFAFGKVEVPGLDENTRCPEKMRRIDDMRDRVKDKNGD